MVGKEKKKKSLGKAKPKIKKEQEKQTKLAIVLMLALFLFVFLVYFLIQGTKNFEYAGLKFKKGTEGSLVFYFAEISMKDATGNVLGYSSFAFREDPRKLENIMINGIIKLKKDVALAANKDFIESCDDSILAGTTLALFLTKSGANAFPATTDKNEAEILERTYVSCDDTDNYSVIEFEKSNANEIIQKGDCYKLRIANCEFMNVTERFMIAALAHSRGIEI